MTYAKVDRNQPRIVECFRKLGAVVLHLHSLGAGAPDLLVGFGSMLALVEIKDPAQPPSKRRLTPDEQKFHENWPSKIWIVETLENCEEVVAWLRRTHRS